jgi:hypothetical protein
MQMGCCLPRHAFRLGRSRRSVPVAIARMNNVGRPHK